MTTEHPGLTWTKIGPHAYRHLSGAVITRAGSLWVTSNGPGQRFASAKDAAAFALRMAIASVLAPRPNAPSTTTKQ